MKAVELKAVELWQDSIEMSPFLLLVANNIAVAECEPGQGARGEGAAMSPFPPAHRLIELHCAHRA